MSTSKRQSTGDKAFVTITNRDIYNKLEMIDGKLDRQKLHIKLLYSGMGLLFALAGILLDQILRR